jgi:parafibromin
VVRKNKAAAQISAFEALPVLAGQARLRDSQKLELHASPKRPLSYFYATSHRSLPGFDSVPLSDTATPIMAQAAQTEVEDPLYNLRLSIKASATPILSTSANPAPADYIDDLARATHITFNVDDAHRTFDLTSDTRFAPDSKPIDLRSCYFAWVNKDASVTDYFAAVTTLNEELPGGAGGSVQNLTFAQKIELVAWLSGETESSDSIAPIDSGAATAAAGDAAAIAGGKGVPVDRNMKSTQGGMVDARLLQIYDGERNMGDHNTVLRGHKPIVGPLHDTEKHPS